MRELRASKADSTSMTMMNTHTAWRNKQATKNRRYRQGPKDAITTTTTIHNKENMRYQERQAIPYIEHTPSNTTV